MVPNTPSLPPLSTFLTAPLTSPPTARVIDWKYTPLPANQDRYAVVLDGVLTPAECAEFVRLAEDDVRAKLLEQELLNNPIASEDTSIVHLTGPTDPETLPQSTCDASLPTPCNPWAGARIQPVGSSVTTSTSPRCKDYGLSERLVYECPELMNRIWARCVAIDKVRQALEAVSHFLGRNEDGQNEIWDFSHMNTQARFLRYGPGKLFAPHVDGDYFDFVNEEYNKALFSMLLYLNDSTEDETAGPNGLGAQTHRHGDGGLNGSAAGVVNATDREDPPSAARCDSYSAISSIPDNYDHKGKVGDNGALAAPRSGCSDRSPNQQDVAAANTMLDVGASAAHVSDPNLQPSALTPAPTITATAMTTVTTSIPGNGTPIATAATVALGTHGGGATSFLDFSTDPPDHINPYHVPHVDIPARAGRVLIFQHNSLLHAAGEVTEGLKYVVRSDLMYVLRPENRSSSGPPGTNAARIVDRDDEDEGDEETQWTWARGRKGRRDRTDRTDGGKGVITTIKGMWSRLGR